MLITTAVITALGDKKRGSSNSSAYIDSGILNSDGNIDTSLYNPHGVRYTNRLKAFFNNFYFNIAKKSIVSFTAALIIMISAFTVAGVFRGDMLVALADEEEWEENAEEAYGNLSNEDHEDPGDDAARYEYFDNLENQDISNASEDNPTGMEAVIQRLFVPGYINSSEWAVSPSQGFSLNDTPNRLCIADNENHKTNNEDAWEPNSYWHPDPNVRDHHGTEFVDFSWGYYHEGVPHYHNCAVPNTITNFLQYIIGEFSEQGVQNAELRSSYSGWGVGVPGEDVLPGGEVPEIESERGNQYTALEVFGYNLNYTMYNGEWDHISILTEGRIAADMGFSERFLVGAMSVVNAVGEFFSTVGGSIADGWNRGNNIFTSTAFAAWGLFTGIVDGLEAAFEAGVLTLLDSYEYQIIQTNSWERVHYPQTVYGARELSATERQEVQVHIIQQALIAIIEEAMNNFDESELPEEPVSADEISDLPPWIGSNLYDDTPQPKANALAAYWEVEVDSEDFYDELGVDGSASIESYESEMDEYIEENSEDIEEDLWDLYWEDSFFSFLEDDAPFGGNEAYYSSLEGCVDAAQNAEVSGNENEGAQSYLDIYQQFRDCWNNAYPSVQQAYEAEVEQIYDEHIENALHGGFVNRLFGTSPAEEAAEGAIEQHMTERPPNVPNSRFVCTDHRGQDIELESGEMPWTYVAGRSIQIEDYCEITVLRPPIQGAAFGDGYIPGDGYTPPVDTRRAEFSAVENILLDRFISTPMNAGANIMIGFTTMITSFSNFLIELSFSPILQSLGLDDTVANLIESFRDSMFFPLAALMVAIAGIVILWKVMVSRQYRQGWYSIFLVVLIFVSGVILMNDPKRLVELSDEIPSTIEGALAAAIFDAGSDDNICSPTGAVPNSDAYQEIEGVEDADGNLATFSPALNMRTMMCENWRVFAFSPWAYGQFGTSYNNLYSNGNEANGGNSLNNSNQELVGDASVDLGNGGIVNNWAVYQLYATTSGTTTNHDTVRATGTVDPNIYRVVDVQAGPNNADRSDPRYFDYWTGNEMMDRMLTSFISQIVAVFGIVTIFLYVILKLEYTMMMTVLLLAMPLMFLLGLEPAHGRAKLRDYFATLLSLMMKRIMVVVLLAFFLRLLSAAEAASPNDSYIGVAILIIIICCAFIMFRKEFMKMVDVAANKVGNANFAGAGDGGGLLNKMTPQSVKDGASVAKNMAAGAVGGGVTGAVLGGSQEYKTQREQGKGRFSAFGSSIGSSIKSGGNNAGKVTKERGLQQWNQMRRRGLGPTASALDTRRAVREELNQRKRQDTDNLDKTRAFALRKDQEERKSLAEALENEGWAKLDKNDNVRMLKDNIADENYAEAKRMKDRINQLDERMHKNRYGNVSSDDFKYLFDGETVPGNPNSKKQLSLKDREKLQQAIESQSTEDLENLESVASRDHSRQNSDSVADSYASLARYRSRQKHREELDTPELRQAVINRLEEKIQDVRNRNAGKGALSKEEKDELFALKRRHRDLSNGSQIGLEEVAYASDDLASDDINAVKNNFLSNDMTRDLGIKDRGFAVSDVKQTSRGVSKVTISDPGSGISVQIAHKEDEGQWAAMAVDHQGNKISDFQFSPGAADAATIVSEANTLFEREAMKSLQEDVDIRDTVVKQDTEWAKDAAQRISSGESVSDEELKGRLDLDEQTLENIKSMSGKAAEDIVKEMQANFDTSSYEERAEEVLEAKVTAGLTDKEQEELVRQVEQGATKRGFDAAVSGKTNKQARSRARRAEARKEQKEAEKRREKAWDDRHRGNKS